MNRFVAYALILWCSSAVSALAQNTAFDSFVSKISDQYKVDIALSPDLIPTVDSILESGTPITSIEVLLHLLVDEHMTYQIVDGNKLMLRKDSEAKNMSGIARIAGTIIDQKDGAPLPYAIVRILNTPYGCQTDEWGNFVLSVQDTSGKIEIDYLGYTTIQKSISEFLKGPVTIGMKLYEVPLEEVTIIIPYKEINQDPTAQSLNLSQYQLISEDQLLQWNVDRLINTLTSYSQFSNEEGIRIRGVEPGNSLFLMDGLPVYDPYHFYNIFSPFNTHYFSSIRLYKNNLPVEYGGRIDGMIRLESDQRLNETHLIVDSDLLMSSLAAKVILNPAFSLSAGARFSYTGILNEALRDSSVMNFKSPGKYKSDNEWTSVEQPHFNFYDINAGINGRVGSNHVYANFFSSEDNLRTTTANELSTTIQNQEIVTVEQLFVTKENWKNFGSSLGILVPLAERTSLSFDGFYSRYVREESYSSDYDEMFFNQHNHRYDTGFQTSKLNTIGLKTTLKKNLSGNNAFGFGLDLNRYNVDLKAQEGNQSYVEQSLKEWEITLFGEYQFQPLKHLTLSTGSRFTHLPSPSKVYWLPNLKGSYFLSDHIHVRAAFSKSVQAVQELTIENRFGRELQSLVLNSETKKYPVLKSDKYMVGAGYTSTNFSFDVEMFYKKLNGLIRVASTRPDPGHDHDPPQSYYALFMGDGWTRGLDVTAYYKKGKTDVVAAYTLSRIAEQYDGLYNGEEYSPQEDRRHQVKLSAKHRLGAFNLSGLMTYKSKAPYLSLVRLEDHNSHGGHGEPGDVGQADEMLVTDYLPEYFSLDLGVDYSFKLLKQSAQIGVSLINATDHLNIEELQHTGRVSRDEMHGLYITQQTELLGRTWNAHVKIMF